MRILLTGGGSGGHFYPLIAVAEALRERDKELGTKVELFYMGPDVFNSVELKKNAIVYVYNASGKQRVYRSWRNFTDKFLTLFGLVTAFLKLYRLYPDVVMSKGGFASVPVIVGAFLLRIPIVIHESDAVPGRANLFGARFACYIGIAQTEAIAHFRSNKTALVGMPIRKTFFVKVPDPQTKIGVNTNKPIIFITGGSLGAVRLNNFVLQGLTKLLSNYVVVHQVGDANLETTTKEASTLIKDKSLLEHYYVMGHLDQEMFVAACQAASLIITRAGSTTLAELAQLGKPAIVVPIPEDISRDQRSNAYAYASGGAATVIEEKNLSDDILVAEIERILENNAVYQKMSQAAKAFTVGNAAYTLADVLIDISKEHE